MSWGAPDHWAQNMTEQVWNSFFPSLGYEHRTQLPILYEVALICHGRSIPVEGSDTKSPFKCERLGIERNVYLPKRLYGDLTQETERQAKVFLTAVNNPTDSAQLNEFNEAHGLFRHYGKKLAEQFVAMLNDATHKEQVRQCMQSLVRFKQNKYQTACGLNHAVE